MIFHRHIETAIGEIWVVNALENECLKLETESRQQFEARVLKRLIQTTVGNVELKHHSSGAPFIENQAELKVSISHSEHWFALYLSKEKSVGVDIELNSPQIEKTKNHFLSESEIERLKPNQSELQICWGVKESIFKLLQGNVNSLKVDVETISINQNRAVATFKSEKIELGFEQSEEFTLVYTTD